MLVKNQWTFSITTLGCKVNQYESQAIAEAWQEVGGIQVNSDQESDVCLVNSCAITAMGERDTRNTLYTIRRKKPQALCILTGCAATLVINDLAKESARKFSQNYSYFDVLIPPPAKAILMQGPWQWQQENLPFIMQEKSVNPFGKSGFAINSFKRSRPIIKVQDGCSHRCTYCIVPLVRGPSVSRNYQEILTETQRMLQAGFGEILLSGINLQHFGRNSLAQEPKDFWDLLELLDKELSPQWQGRARIRISSLEPSQINDKALEIISNSKLLCPHLHLSLQHGSMRILKAMGRGHYNLLKLELVIQALREHFPKLGLGADILMGFAGEEEEDVLATLTLIESLNLSYAHVFPYSKRPGTAASNFDNQVAKNIKLERAARVRKLVQKQNMSFLQSLLQEQYLDIVIDNHAQSNNLEQLYKGIDAHYAPCSVVLGANLPKQGIIRVKPERIDNDVVITKLYKNI